jgi:thioredoxin reductase (NADPH)
MKSGGSSITKKSALALVIFHPPPLPPNKLTIISIHAFRRMNKKKTMLRTSNVKYLNAYGTLIDKNTVEYTTMTIAEKKTNRISGKHIVVATGGRPRFPDFPGATEYCISSDDLFWLRNPPGKTLVVGGSYVALECAGFLRGFGFDVAVMVRSILLRGFDRQMADIVGEHLESDGVRMIRHCVPSGVEKLSSGKLSVRWKNAEGTETVEEFDTVLCAVGRSPIGNSLLFSVRFFFSNAHSFSFSPITFE